MKTQLRAITSLIALIFAFVQGSAMSDTTTNPSAQPPATDRNDLEADIREAIKIGEMRVFDPSGPKMSLGPRFYKRLIDHPEIAKPLLEEKTRSDAIGVRCNAYDFISQFAFSSVERDWAIDLLNKATHDQSEMVRTFARNSLGVLKQPSTAPSTQSSK